MSDSPTPPIADRPLAKPPSATVTVPGSKSITNRALVLAALTRHGPCTAAQAALRSEDTEVMVDCLRQLGFDVRADWDERRVAVTSSTFTIGRDCDSRTTAADLFVGNSGTTMRFLTAMVASARARYRLDGVPRMRERPIEDLLDALQQLGVDARSEPATAARR